MLEFEVRPSRSPFVERVWRARSREGGWFTSIAAANHEIVVERQARVAVILRGPESAATRALCPPDTEWLGIRLRVGTYARSVPANRIRDGRDVVFDVHDEAFVFENGAALPLPRFDDAEAFVHGLARAGYLRRDAWVEAVASGASTTARGGSTRTIQRRFVRVTGLSRQAFVQIERARFATHLLVRGCGIADTVFLTGFVDQAHLARTLRRYVGMTPTAIEREEGQLSLLYKTDVRPWAQSAS